MSHKEDLPARVAALYPDPKVSIGQEAAVRYFDHMNISAPTREDLRRADEAYVGEYASDLKFAYEFAENIGLFSNLPKWGRDSRDAHPCELYFNWDAYARDLMYDYFEVDGFYFHSY